MGSTLTNLVYHVVFITQARERLIHQKLREELYLYMGGIVKGEGGVLLQIGSMTDHVHLVLKLKPIHNLSEMMQKIKGNSSKWINAETGLAGRFRWQDGYGAFTVSESHIPVVVKYIKEQEKHHSDLSFKDAFVRILNRHQIEYNEQYPWD